MNPVYLLIGGNIGDRLYYLDKACKGLEQHSIEILRKSSIYETAAWGNTAQSAFLNQVLEVSTQKTASELLNEILSIEEDMGRKRLEKNGARTIDIDILYFKDEVINEPGLKIPHERIAFRKFVLIPMNELHSDLLDPSKGKTINQLLLDCEDELDVSVYNQNAQIKK